MRLHVYPRKTCRLRAAVAAAALTNSNHHLITLANSLPRLSSTASGEWLIHGVSTASPLPQFDLQQRSSSIPHFVFRSKGNVDKRETRRRGEDRVYDPRAHTSKVCEIESAIKLLLLLLTTLNHLRAIELNPDWDRKWLRELRVFLWNRFWKLIN